MVGKTEKATASLTYGPEFQTSHQPVQLPVGLNNPSVNNSKSEKLQKRNKQVTSMFTQPCKVNGNT